MAIAFVRNYYTENEAASQSDSYVRKFYVFRSQISDLPSQHGRRHEHFSPGATALEARFQAYNLGVHGRERAGRNVHIVYQKHLDSALAGQVQDILEDCGDEFVPPLSTRMSTHQSKLDDLVDSGNGVRAYFDELSTQPFVLALDDDGRVLAFLSFIENYQLDFLDCGKGSDYISTICTRKEYRRRGLASQLYAFVENELRPRLITIRTWSTNDSQLSLLKNRGYRLVEQIKDGRGQGIDTVYYAKEPEAR